MVYAIRLRRYNRRLVTEGRLWEICMNRARWIALLLLLWLAPRAVAVLPGGTYSTDESMKVTIDPRLWPRTLGYHVVRGSAVYHGRQLPFACGIFLPPAFFHTTEPMPVLMALHNRFAIGFNGGPQMAGEGMGRILAYGGDEDRMVGDRVENPIVLRKDAGFIGLIPQCPADFAWEMPAMVHMECDFIAQVVAHYHADDNRVYLTGFSYGASSTWRMALLAPDRFAAIICCDGRATPDPINDVAKLKDTAIYLEVGQWDGPFVEETDRMHQALNTLPHRNYIFRMVPGGNHFCYEAVYDDPEVWKWVFAQRRKPKSNSVSTLTDPEAPPP